MLRQIRGAFIGSPLSPPWCELVVMLAKYQWTTSLSTAALENHFAAVRYGDNRLALCLADAASREPNRVLASFQNHEFYGAPIRLESETGIDFVGCGYS